MYGGKNIKSGVSKELARTTLHRNTLLCVYIHGYHAFSCVHTFTIFSNGGAIMRFSGLRPATVINYANRLNLKRTGECQFTAEGNLQRYNLLLFYFYSPIRYSVNMLRLY